MIVNRPIIPNEINLLLSLWYRKNSNAYASGPIKLNDSGFSELVSIYLLSNSGLSARKSSKAFETLYIWLFFFSEICPGTTNGSIAVGKFSLANFTKIETNQDIISNI